MSDEILKKVEASTQQSSSGSDVKNETVTIDPNTSTEEEVLAIHENQMKNLNKLKLEYDTSKDKLLEVQDLLDKTKTTVFIAKSKMDEHAFSIQTYLKILEQIRLRESKKELANKEELLSEKDKKIAELMKKLEEMKQKQTDEKNVKEFSIENVIHKDNLDTTDKKDDSSMK